MVTSIVTVFAQEPRFNISTFESVKLYSKGYYNGDDSKGGFENGHFFYRTLYNSSWKSWSGIAVSNHSDTLTNSYTNEYSNICGTGNFNSKNFAICFNLGTIICQKPTIISGLYVTNTTYTYHTIKNGSAYSKKFGGKTGNDTDWYRAKFVSYRNGNRADSVYFYLADFRFADNSKDYIIKNWVWVDLSGIKTPTDSLIISFESTDNGVYGMNTPAYMAFDNFNNSSNIIDIYNIKASFLNDSNKIWNGKTDTSGGFDINGFYFVNNYNTSWNSWSGWAISIDNDTSKKDYNAQYSSITASQLNLISYGRSVINLPSNKTQSTMYFYLSNNTYTYKSMKYGDAFCKKFGGKNGDEKDFLKLNIIKYSDDENTDTSVVYLADFINKPSNIASSNIICKVTLNENTSRIEFQLESSDNGIYGMNTPAFFCLSAISKTNKLASEKIHKIKVFPNPAVDYIITEISNVESYEIADITGANFTFETMIDSNKIDISKLPGGVYILKLKSVNNYYYTRFVK